MHMGQWLLTLSALGMSAAVPAQTQQRAVQWQVEQTTYSGVLVYNEQGAAKRPGIVLVPNWFGVTDTAVERAAELAGQDYVVLVADVFGQDIRPKDSDEAASTITPLLADRTLLRTRAAAALEALKAQADNAPLDITRLAAVGFCFGGSTALEMARAGLALDAVVSLHGGLATPLPAKEKIKPSVLVLNGAADSMITAQDIADLHKEMDAAQADWQFVNFGGAVHCFAEVQANFPPGCVYHPLAGPRAWRMMRDFLQETVLDKAH